MVLAILLALPAAGEGVYNYRLRGEIRLLLLWLGRDDVGGGSIRITREAPADGRWQSEIEVLFGSDPERVPKGINRWGYGRERAEWIQDPAGAGPRLMATEFQGIMRHSPEGSIDEAVAATKQANSSQQFLYDATVCIGCKACQAACKRANDNPPVFSTAQHLYDNPTDLDAYTFNIIKLYRNGSAQVKDREKDGYSYVKRHCMHCVDPSCVSACPVSALTKDPKTGIVRYDKGACIGCRYCIFFHTESAKLNGATEAEIKETVLLAARVRSWGTMMYGTQYDLEDLKKDSRKIVEGLKKRVPAGVR